MQSDGNKHGDGGHRDTRMAPGKRHGRPRGCRRLPAHRERRHDVVADGGAGHLSRGQVRHPRRGRGVRRGELRVRRGDRRAGGEQDGVSMSHPEFTLHDLLRNSVERDPDKLAIVDGGAEYTYGDLDRQSNALSAALQEAGVENGDRVGVYMEKSWEAIVAMLAASRAGAAYVNINPLFKPPQVAYVARDCDVRAMIGDSARLDDLEPGTVQGTAFYKGDPPREGVAGTLEDLAEVLQGGETPLADRQVSEVDLGTILYTSGSTGVPPLWALLLRSARAIEEEPLTQLRYIANTGGRIPQANLEELKRLLADGGGTRIYLMYGLTEAF